MQSADRLDYPEGSGPYERNVQGSYASNSWLWTQGKMEPDIWQFLGVMPIGLFGDRTEEEIAYPAETIMMTDGDWMTMEAKDFDFCGQTYPDNAGQNYHGAVALRHNGGFDALFADGHVKWLRNSTWRMWAADPDRLPAAATACPSPAVLSGPPPYGG
jgi:prepilin-type processing-associated H-X9-DG protein